MTASSKAEKLFSFEFLALAFISFFAFCNMAVFYSFFSYLGKIGIPPEWRGLLLSLEPLSAVTLRLVVLPLLHLGNAVKAMFLALLLLIFVLCSYSFATSILAIALLRILHGAAFVLLISGSLALVSQFIPKSRSAQGFGILSIATLLPYALMPLMCEALQKFAFSETQIYAGVTILILPGLFMLFVLNRRLKTSFQGVDAALMKRPNLTEVWQDVRQPGIALLLALNLFVCIAYSSTFYFMQNLAMTLGLPNVSLFFLISSLTMLAVRLFAGSQLDRIDKVTGLMLAVSLLALSLFTLPRVSSPLMFHVLAGFYGVFLGILFPLLNSAMFSISHPNFRGLNSNLLMFMTDGGYFLNPLLGGMLLAAGQPLSVLFGICAGLLILCLPLLLILGKMKHPGLEVRRAS